MKYMIAVVALVLLCGCSVAPTTNSTISFLCEKRINNDGDTKYKCSNKRLVAFRVKFK